MDRNLNVSASTAAGGNQLENVQATAVESGQWSAMAQHIDGQRLMRPQTSMGLAKALHEDFGVHDSTPSKLEPSPLAMAVGADEAIAAAAAAASEAVAMEDARDAAAEEEAGDSLRCPTHTSATGDVSSSTGFPIKLGDPKELSSRPPSPFINGDWPQELELLDDNASRLEENGQSCCCGTSGKNPSYDNNNTNNFSESNTHRAAENKIFSSPSPRETAADNRGSSPNSPTPRRPPIPSGSTPPSLPSGQQTTWNIVSLSRRSPLLGVEDNSSVGLPRNASFESDCQSLGFNAREALVQLRSQDGFFIANSVNNPGSIGSDVDPHEWQAQEERKCGSRREESKQRKKESGDESALRQGKRTGCCIM